jgi:hypothetical protein
MLTLQQITELANKQAPAPGPYPTAINVWYAYKHGKFIGTAPTQEDCWKIYNTHITERVCTNQDVIDCWRQQLRLHQQAIHTIWYNALREEYADISDALFDLCYGEAYDRGHSLGYSEMEGVMSSVVSFARKVLTCRSAKLENY